MARLVAFAVFFALSAIPFTLPSSFCSVLKLLFYFLVYFSILTLEKFHKLLWISCLFCSHSTFSAPLSCWFASSVRCFSSLSLYHLWSCLIMWKFLMKTSLHFNSLFACIVGACHCCLFFSSTFYFRFWRCCCGCICIIIIYVFSHMNCITNCFLFSEWVCTQTRDKRKINEIPMH